MTEPTVGTPAPAPAQRPLRADARRNHRRLLAAARVAFTEHGAEASLDDIARRAGVGSGTLYRHFPTRQALMEAVYRDQVEALCAQGYELLDSLPPGDALAAWLRALADYIATKRGLASTLTAIMGDQGSQVFASCKQALFAVATALLTRAQGSGAVRPDADVRDLLMLVHAIAVAAEQAPDGAERLLVLVMDGLRHQQPSASQPASGEKPVPRT
jgi:AcrR family transcriptional regulator